MMLKNYSSREQENPVLSGVSSNGSSSLAEPVVAEELVVAYNDNTVIAVDGLSFTVQPGEVLGILGGNGAGKTSTLRALGGILPPSGGKLHIGGFDMNSPQGSEMARRVTGYCPDTGGLIRQATIREHIGVALGMRGLLEFWPRALELVELFDLSYVLDRETGGFSHGMSRRLSVLLAALTAEKLLVLDEPFDGVDPLGVNATRDVIRNAASAGLGVVVSTHLLSLLVQVSDRICVMSKGVLVDSADSHAFEGVIGEERYEELLRHKNAVSNGKSDLSTQSKPLDKEIVFEDSLETK